jgi:DegV family protein with EDD domain
MPNIALLTDSTCDLPPAWLAEKNIALVPLSVFFGDREYRDAVDLTPDQFYHELAKFPGHPTTSQPSVGSFLEAYERLQSQGATHVFGLFITRKFSGTAQAAGTAAQMIPGLKVEVFDSKTTSWGLGMLLLQAHQWVQAGLPPDEVAALIRAAIERVRIFFSVDTLDALQKGGRIGKAAAFLGKHLGIRPILSLTPKTGEIEVVEKVHSRAAAVSAMIRLALDHRRSAGLAFGVTLIHSALPEVLPELKNALQAAGGDWKNVLEGRIGAVIGTHLGADGWGLALC